MKIIFKIYTNIVFESKDDLVLLDNDIIGMKEPKEIRDKIKEFSKPRSNSKQKMYCTITLN